MGKEWHFGGSRSSRRATVDHRRRRHRPSLSGCMNTLFHFFDFRSSHFTSHFVFDKHHTSSLDLSRRPPPLPKANSHRGVEAPRNSLELDEANSKFCLRNKEENFQIQMGVQIKTRNGSEQQLPNIIHDHIALESPSANTPNLLARLMGLDILPQTSTPSSSSFRHRPNSGACNYYVSGTRSLPESPRVSSARLSDVDRHRRRLSFQISLEKENIKIHDENINIKREKEKVMRRKIALVDITNNSKSLDFGERKVGLSRRNKGDKSSKRLKKTIADDELSSKPRNLEVVVLEKQKSMSMSMLMLIPKPKRKRKAKGRVEEEAFGCPRSNNKVDNNLNRPTGSPQLAAKVPHEQPCSYPKGKQKPPAGDGGERNGVGSTGTRDDGGEAEFKYIKRILTSHGISMEDDIPISSPNWFSPSIFHHLETTTAAEDAAVEDPTRHRCNRRLLFHLVDEMLGEIFVNKKSSCWHVRRRRRRMKGWELAEEVRERVEELPRANCKVLEDIDALIDKDLGKSKPEIMSFTFTAVEIEGIVKLVEFHILDSLLTETLSFCTDEYGF